MDTSFYIFGAFTLGILHALSPGHGKAIVGAYLVGSKGRIIDAVLLGIIVTLTHTGGVILLGIAAVIASAYIIPEKVQQASSLISGILIFIVGGWLLYKRIIHAYQHRHNLNHNHSHSHEHEHRQNHHSNNSSPAAPSLNMLLALGISGGIVPCPEALVVLLMAIGSGKILSGLIYVFIFSFGLASVLIVIGIILVKAGILVQGFLKEGRTNQMARVLSIVSAIIITLLGVYLIVQTGRNLL